MRNLKTKSLGFTIAVTIVFFLLLGVVSLLSGALLSEELQQYDLELFCWINATAQLVLAVGVVVLMKRLNIFRDEEFTSKGLLRGIWSGFVGIVFALFMFAINFWGNLEYVQSPKLSYFIACLFIAFTTGLFEEVLVRGFVINNLKRHYGDSVSSLKRIVIVSSVLFGVLHFVNLSGFALAQILETLAQVLSSIVIGMFFALVYLESKNIWAVVIVHALIDAAAFVLYSVLSVEAFSAAESGVASTGTVVFESLIVPLLTMLPFAIAVWLKWRKLGVGTIEVNKI